MSRSGGFDRRTMSSGTTEAQQDPRVDRFLALSAALTGFNRVELQGTGMTSAYLSAIGELVPEAIVERLLDRAEGPVDEVLADGELGPVARSVILLWYTGAWTPPPDDGHPAGGAAALEERRVVSGDAYVAGLQWVAAGAHPVGARQQGFGAWAVPPEPPWTPERARAGA